MSVLRIPIVTVVTGEGGSGGALGIGVCDRLLMLQYSTYSVISPEGCASILWKSQDKKEVAAEALNLTADRLLKLGLVDEVIEEPLGGAHRDPAAVAASLKAALVRYLDELDAIPRDQLRARARGQDRRLRRIRRERSLAVARAARGERGEFGPACLSARLAQLLPQFPHAGGCVSPSAAAWTPPRCWQRSRACSKPALQLRALHVDHQLQPESRAAGARTAGAPRARSGCAPGAAASACRARAGSRSRRPRGGRVTRRWRPRCAPARCC